MTATDPFGFVIPADEYAAYMAEQAAQDEEAERLYTEWLDRQEAGEPNPDAPF